MWTILVVDDHNLFREGLVKLISHWDDFAVIGEVANGQQAVEKIEALLPDLVLMDIKMPVMDGLEATEKIARRNPSTRIVMLTSSEEEEDLFRAIKIGACGYVLKDIKSDRLRELLIGAMQGEAALSSMMATKIMNEFAKSEYPHSTSQDSALEPLTDRETQVLQLVVEGLTNYEISKRIFLSENTVKKHLGNILQKLHLNNRVEAAVFAVKEGIIKP
ncbi:MAG: response regulator transcription factor [Anaerolineales bacterium]|nr:response regulator transcription factor [Anaerolineales bacterium]